MDEEESLLTEEEFKILNIAMRFGYFEYPRRITLDSLAQKLSKNPRYINNKLKDINKKVLMKFIEKMNTPLKG
jgi:predicted DNA binding protein